MITAITTTKNRPLCFSLLERWVDAQTIKPDQWIVATSGDEGYSYNRNQEVVRRPPNDAPGWQDLLENWRCALPAIKGYFTVVLEDDDYYHPTYIERVVGLLADNEVAGVGMDLYYKLAIKKYQRMGNTSHASLAATGLYCTMYDQFAKVIETCQQQQSPFLDMFLWAQAEPLFQARAKLIGNRAQDGKPLHIGFKMMPGAKGLGNGHFAEGGGNDQNFAMLREWLPLTVARQYETIYRELTKA